VRLERRIAVGQQVAGRERRIVVEAFEKIPPTHLILLAHQLIDLRDELIVVLSDPARNLHLPVAAH